MTHGPIRRVAVIGAGISGVVSAAHLLAAELEVTVLERNHAAGGVWLYDERKPLEPSYTYVKPLESESKWHEIQAEGERAPLEHAPPGACYEGLTNNVSTPCMRLKLNAWPEGTPDFVNHRILKEYIQDTSVKAGVDEVTIYGARVKNVHKDGNAWHVGWSTLVKDPQDGFQELDKTEVFDAVIVASGHYHAPRIPPTPGLAEAKARWPERIFHSKRYRRPDGYTNKNVLLIGGGVSAIDIAKEISSVAKKVYQSTRNGEFDIPSNILPENGVRISEIAKFEVEHDTAVPNDEPLPLKIHLKSGQTLCGVDIVVICTGYHVTVPFLPGYHDDQLSSEQANESILVTDGSQVHNLHKDIFYIPDPSLAFVGVPYFTATFTLFEFQAIVLANVFGGIATLPPRTEMRQEYTARVAEAGTGKRFHSLKDKEEIYVNDLLKWVNAAREQLGLDAIEGHTETWLKAKEAQRGRVKELFAGNQRRDSGIGALSVLEPCSINAS